MNLQRLTEGARMTESFERQERQGQRETARSKAEQTA
jgi:hypothetical protein